MNEIMEKLPPMLYGKELEESLQVLPLYDESIRMESATTRLLSLSNLHRIYFPTYQSKEVYTKLYLAIVRGLEKKQTKCMTKQYYKNMEMARGKEFTGTVSYSDSFSILGDAGVGKSSAVSRAVNVIGGDKVIEINNPYTKIIPCLIVETPHDSSVKGLLIEILRKIDEHLGTQYYMQAIRYHSTVDMLIGAVSNSLISHSMLLILEEIQNLLNNKQNAQKLISALIQLINNSGVTICLVGLPICADLLKKEQHLARRSLGIRFNVMKYDNEFYQFCKTIFKYQYVKNKTEIDDATVYWLYSHSNGNPAIITSLIEMAQEQSILNGSETLNLSSLKEAYKKMDMLHGFIECRELPITSTVKKPKMDLELPENITIADIKLSSIITDAKKKGDDVVEVLRGYINVEEVRI